MADVTITIALSLVAIAMSLVFLNRVAPLVAQVLSYVGMAVLGLHTIGVQISAPMTDATAEIIANSVFAWLIIGVFAVCARGAHRLISGRTDLSNCS
jgi:hypothetical protein